MAKKYTRRNPAQDTNNTKRTLYLVIGGIVLLLGGLAAAILYDRSTTPSINPDTQFQTSQGRDHVDPGIPLEFALQPPTSGNHFANSLAWGVYSELINPGYWVHSLEHGGIVLLYNCTDLSADACEDLRDDAESFYGDAPFNGCAENRVIVMPYSQGMETPVTVLAWQQRLDLDDYNYRDLVDFYRLYEEQGPEALPCGANGRLPHQLEQ